jgi:hypothetical protein
MINKKELLNAIVCQLLISVRDCYTLRRAISNSPSLYNHDYYRWNYLKDKLQLIFPNFSGSFPLCPW